MHKDFFSENEKNQANAYKIWDKACQRKIYLAFSLCNSSDHVLHIDLSDVG